jgi:hypothetical protein
MRRLAYTLRRSVITGWVSATAGKTRSRAISPSQLGWVRWSEGSDVGCSHAGDCPLFPLLKASLRDWRDYYCDSEDRWLECARYELSLTGERVPISLLPNGRHAQHLRRAADAAWSDADPRKAPGQNPASGPIPRSQDPASWFLPAPPPPPPGRSEPSRPGAGAPETGDPFEPAPPPVPVRHRRPYPTYVPQPSNEPPDRPDQHVRQAPGSKRGWWARLVDWMRGPA